jgi:hypothetical protein
VPIKHLRSVGNVFMLGAGGVIVVMLSAYFGLYLSYFMEETYYDRRLRPKQQPQRRRHRAIPFAPSAEHSPSACLRVLKVLVKPTPFLSSLYYCLTCAWVAGINTKLSVFGYPAVQLRPEADWLFLRYARRFSATGRDRQLMWLHHFTATSTPYIRSHKERFEPEVRLRAIYFTPFMIAGLILIGFCLEDAYHYMITNLVWGM